MPGTTDRRDVRRNRRAILDAAHAVFAGGGDVPMYEVARRAGVGQATLYRHFPDRSALAAEVGDELLSGIEARTAAADPALPLEEVMLVILETSLQDPGLVTAIAEGESARRVEEFRDRITELLRDPLDAAKASARVRADITLGDVVLLIQMIQGGLQRAGGTRGEQDARGHRALALALQAMRA